MQTIAILLVLSGISAVAESRKGEPAMSDYERIQGRWVLVSGERHGKEFSADVVKGVTLEFSQDTLSTHNRDRVSTAKFKLHSETAPKGIDMDMDGSTGRGIYKLDGDTLTILHGEVQDDRPTEFDPRKTPRLTLLQLKRNAQSPPEPRR
jgi:uncharacterized protein (TIGR03067 family)